LKKHKLKLKILREREIAHTVYTGSLLNQELHPVFQKPLGNPLSNQTWITNTHHQRSDIDPLKKHTSFGSAHTPTSRAHKTSCPTTPQFTQSTEGLHLLHNELKSIQMKSYPTLS